MYGTSITLSSTTPTKTGYTFTDWNTSSDGTGTSYAPGGSYSANENMSSSDVLGRADQTLYEAKKTRNTIQIYKNV